MRLLTAGSSVRAGLQEPEKAVKIDAICFDRFLMRVLSIFEEIRVRRVKNMVNIAIYNKSKYNKNNNILPGDE